MGTNAAVIHNDKIEGDDPCVWSEDNPDDNCIWDENKIGEVVKENVMIFGFMQILCVVWAPLIGYVLDKKLTNCKPNPQVQLSVTNREEELLISEKNKKEENNSNGITYERVQKLRNTRDAYFITTVYFTTWSAKLISHLGLFIGFWCTDHYARID